MDQSDRINKALENIEQNRKAKKLKVAEIREILYGTP